MIENFGNNRNTSGFDKNPENINRTGANRKSIASVNIELESKGYTAASQKDITDCYLRLMNVDLPELSEMVKDEKRPAMVRIVGKAILSGKGFDIIEKMLDRSIGKASQSLDITSKGKQIPLTGITFKDGAETDISE